MIKQLQATFYKLPVTASFVIMPTGYDKIQDHW